VRVRSSRRSLEIISPVLTVKHPRQPEMSVLGSDGLILPRKVMNPCLENSEARNLNKQIKWNAKAGVNVLNKSELDRVLERQRRLRLHREKEDVREEQEQDNPFTKLIKERAKRLQQIEAEEAEETMVEENTSTVSQRSTIFEQKPSVHKPSARRAADTAPSATKPQQTSRTEPSRSQVNQPNKTNMSSSSPPKNSSWRGSSHTAKNSSTQKSISNQEISSGVTKSSSWQRSSAEQRSSWDGNSSGSSSKSSSPEPESEFFKVFSQLRGANKNTEH